MYIDRRQSRASNVENDPLLSRRRSSAANSYNRAQSHNPTHSDASRSLPAVAGKQDSTTAVANNTYLLLGVMLAGCLGWFLAWKSGVWSVTIENGERQDISWIGACLGYMSAALYLGARVPQILKNYNNKSCDGLSILFFLLSLMGNITYGAGVSILYWSYQTLDLPFDRFSFIPPKNVMFLQTSPG